MLLLKKIITHMAHLDYAEIMAHLQTGWTFNPEKNAIEKEYERKDFLDSVAFIAKIAECAELLDHHPDIFLHEYKKVLITLSTHDEDGITELDFVLASQIDLIP